MNKTILFFAGLFPLFTAHTQILPKVLRNQIVQRPNILRAISDGMFFLLSLETIYGNIETLRHKNIISSVTSSFSTLFFDLAVFSHFGVPTKVCFAILAAGMPRIYLLKNIHLDNSESKDFSQRPEICEPEVMKPKNSKNISFVHKKNVINSSQKRSALEYEGNKSSRKLTRESREYLEDQEKEYPCVLFKNKEYLSREDVERDTKGIVYEGVNVGTSNEKKIYITQNNEKIHIIHLCFVDSFEEKAFENLDIDTVYISYKLKEKGQEGLKDLVSAIASCENIKEIFVNPMKQNEKEDLESGLQKLAQEIKPSEGNWESNIDLDEVFRELGREKDCYQGYYVPKVSFARAKSLSSE